MRRLARRLFASCAAVSLFLCVVLLVLWVRSYRPGRVGDGETFKARLGQHVYAARSERGSLRLFDIRVHPMPELTPDDRTIHDSLEPLRSVSTVIHFFRPNPTGVWRGLGVGFASLGESEVREMNLDLGGFAVIELRHLILTVASAVLPAGWAVALFRRSMVKQRVRRGRCPSCGYDLRASPERCPECGARATR